MSNTIMIFQSLARVTLLTTHRDRRSKHSKVACIAFRIFVTHDGCQPGARWLSVFSDPAPGNDPI